MSLFQNIELQQGVYTLHEAALYARLKAPTLKRWLHGNGQGERVVDDDDDESGDSPDDDRYVTFLEFVQALAIHAIRTEHRVPLQRIRDAVTYVKTTYGVDYPLARRHTTFLMGQDLYIYVDGVEDPIKASGTNKGQQAAKKIVEVFMTDLGFDPNGLAAEYRPFSLGILMDPRVKFGEPVIESCKISALALWNAVATEGGIEPAAAAYGVTSDDVKAALRFFDIIEGRPAA